MDQSVRVHRGDKPAYPGSLPDKALAECATVDCVVQLFEEWHAYDTWRHQFFFGDASGESAIVEPKAVLRKEGAYQVVTNFYQSTTPPQSCTCDRYRTATQMLESMTERTTPTRAGSCTGCSSICHRMLARWRRAFPPTSGSPAAPYRGWAEAA